MDTGPMRRGLEVYNTAPGTVPSSESGDASPARYIPVPRHLRIRPSWAEPLPVAFGGPPPSQFCGADAGLPALSRPAPIQAPRVLTAAPGLPTLPKHLQPHAHGPRRGPLAVASVRESSSDSVYPRRDGVGPPPATFPGTNVQPAACRDRGALDIPVGPLARAAHGQPSSLPLSGGAFKVQGGAALNEARQDSAKCPVGGPAERQSLRASILALPQVPARWAPPARVPQLKDRLLRAATTLDPGSTADWVGPQQTCDLASHAAAVEGRRLAREAEIWQAALVTSQKNQERRDAPRPEEQRASSIIAGRPIALVPCEEPSLSQQAVFRPPSAHVLPRPPQAPAMPPPPPPPPPPPAASRRGPGVPKPPEQKTGMQRPLTTAKAPPVSTEELQAAARQLRVVKPDVRPQDNTAQPRAIEDELMQAIRNREYTLRPVVRSQPGTASGMGPTKHATFLCQTPPSLLDKIRQRQAHMRVDSGALWDRETSECC